MAQKLTLKDFIKNIVVITIIVFLFFIYFFHKNKIETSVEKSEILMDTIVTIKIFGYDKNYLEDILENCFSKIKELSFLLNNYNESSEISKINRNAGIKPVKVKRVVVKFLKKALNLCKKTDGYLDITIGAELYLWGFNTQSPHIPNLEKLKKAVKLRGIQYVKINEKDCFVFITKKGIKLDVGAVAKGFIIDKVIEYLKKIKIKKAVVNAGGDIRFLGVKNKRSFWRVGIRDPFSKDKSKVIKVIKVGSWAIVTSGDYERFFIENGVKYHHILNPWTGFPSRKCKSVSVCADSAFIADGLATAIFVMGNEIFKKKYYKKFSKLNHFKVIIIKDKEHIFEY